MNQPSSHDVSFGPGPPQLRIRLGTTTRIVDLHADRFVMGRLATADIPLPDPAVSREHAEAYRDTAGQWHIRDLGSRNGTFINGERITDHVLSNVDECRIGPFALMLARAGARESIASSPTRKFRLSQVALPSMQSLSEFPAPKIGAVHHTMITEFAHQLDGIAEAAHRLEALCALVVHPEFHGMSAITLRLTQGGSLEAMCDTQSSDPRWLTDPPHVSRTLLQAVMDQDAPVLASSVPTADMAMDMSVSIDTAQIAAIGCPLRRDESSCDILYVSFPAGFGTGEWLALVSLAARQYQQTEANLIVRRQQIQQAANDRELTRARKVQMRLVPDATLLATLPGFDATVSFEPCMHVGGDYVDACVTADGQILLVLADVSGKGMSAALVTSMVHTMIHTLVHEGQPFADLMSRINTYLCDYLEVAMFVTAFAALIDPSTGRMECVNAGHPPAILIQPNGTFRTLQMGENLPLGVDRLAMESQQEFIQVGEMLVVYSDGLSETSDSSGRLIGIDRVATDIATICRDCGPVPPPQIAGRIAAHIRSMDVKPVAHDDRTFLLARRTATTPAMHIDSTTTTLAAGSKAFNCSV